MGRIPVTDAIGQTERMLSRVALALAMGISACAKHEPERVDLGVQLLTDFEAGRDFVSIELELEGVQGARRTGALAEPFAYLEPQRVADFRELSPASSRRVEVRLLDAQDQVVIERSVQVPLRASATRTVIITRSCLGVPCSEDGSTSCLAGECVAATCSAGTEPSCTTRSAICANDTDCSAPACHESRCLRGICLVYASEDCLDGGSSEASTPDAGEASPLSCDASVCRLDASCARHLFKDHFYWLCAKSKPYADAKAFCEADGTQLAVIDDEEENLFVTNLIQSASGVRDRRAQHYLGLDDSAAEGSFVWANGKPLDYQNWENGAPSNTTTNQCMSENCVTIWANGSWNDVCCLSSFPFLCETK